MGAWIEIAMMAELSSLVAVAPHVGAWIEIATGKNIENAYSSHPTWVRGLK